MKPDKGAYLEEQVNRFNRCPKCRGELDTGYECTECGFDAISYVSAEDQDHQDYEGAGRGEVAPDDRNNTKHVATTGVQSGAQRELEVFRYGYYMQTDPNKSSEELYAEWLERHPHE